MKVKNMTEFRKSMKETLDYFSDNDETVVISKSDDRDVVMLSRDKYNSLQETIYLMSSPKNHQRLTKAIEDVNKGRNEPPKALTRYICTHKLC